MICWNGRRIAASDAEHVYILLNKPRGYLSAVHDQRGRKCVTDLIRGVDRRIYPVGRLDYISEGILLLTDDGELTFRLTHPTHEIPKVYRVKVAGLVTKEQLDLLSSPMEIDGYRIRPVKVSVHAETDTGTVLSFTLCEGRNRQIRKMCEAAHLTVKRLNRVSIGKLHLDGLAVGSWRYLTPDEIEYLYRITDRKEK